MRATAVLVAIQGYIRVLAGALLRRKLLPWCLAYSFSPWGMRPRLTLSGRGLPNRP